MTHRPSMGGVLRRLAFHLRPHGVLLVAFLCRRIGLLCVVVGVLGLLGSTGARVVDVPLTAAGWSVPSGGTLPDGLPAGTVVEDPAAGGDVVVSLPGASALEQVLVRGGSALVWLCAGVAGLLVAPLLRTFADGDPFAARNPRRLGGVAVAVLLATHAVPLLAPLAAHLALDRLGVPPPFEPAWGFPLHPSLLAVAVLLLLAGALRQGRALEQDVAGLV